MKFISANRAAIKGSPVRVEIGEALEKGLSPEGGLFVPEKLPKMDLSSFEAIGDLSSDASLAKVGAILLRPFFEEDEILGPALTRICERAFNFPVPLTPVPHRTHDYFLELYHGPTAAFKDIGARFLAGCFEEIMRSHRGARPEPGLPLRRTVLVATSGDTGGAVAAAFHGKPNIDVVILYPKGKVSPRQELQLSAWGGNVQAFSVRGTFDDCQRMAKEALGDQGKSRSWISANSINLGRILPQMVYYARVVLSFFHSKGFKEPPSFIIPSGNLGNSLAALWVKFMGFPVGRIILSLNANQGVASFLETGVFAPRTSVATLANAMDVGHPSNLERIRALFPDHESLKAVVEASSVDDDAIRAEIKRSESDWGQVLCPHTATAAVTRKRISRRPAARDSHPWILVATAHPAKFERIVEPLIGHTIVLPPSLAEILKRAGHSREIDPTLMSLEKALTSPS